MTRATMHEQVALGMIGQGAICGHADAPETEYVTHAENANLISGSEIRSFLDRGWAFWSDPDDTGMRKLRWTEAGRKAYDGPAA